jgi:hypothetical protein
VLSGKSFKCPFGHCIDIYRIDSIDLIIFIADDLMIIISEVIIQAFGTDRMGAFEEIRQIVGWIKPFPTQHTPEIIDMK